MANCTATEVKLIITTNKSDADVTSLITLADAEISARGLDTRNANILKTISMYLTADLIANTKPPSASIGSLGSSEHSVQMWRLKAEDLIRFTGEPPIKIRNDPLPNE